MSLSKQLKQELYKEAQVNGFNSQEYLLLLTGVDNLLDDMATHTVEFKTGTHPTEYDVNGKEEA